LVEKGKKKLEDIISIDILDTLNKFEELELEDVELEVGELELWIQPGAGKVTVSPRVGVEEKPTRMLEAEFKPPFMTYPGKILEVKLGATKKEGGSRSKSFLIGGETTLPFYNFESKMTHKPVISFDVFDTKIQMRNVLRL